MNKKDDKQIFRKCVLSRKTFDRSELIKITYVKSSNNVYVNLKNKYKGSSIYFHVDKIKEVGVQNIVKIVNKKFKVLINDDELDILKELFK